MSSNEDAVLKPGGPAFYPLCRMSSDCAVAGPLPLGPATFLIVGWGGAYGSAASQCWNNAGPPMPRAFARQSSIRSR